MLYRTTVPGDLPHEAAADETAIHAARQVDGADPGHGVVGERHLLLDLEVAGVAQALDDEVDAGDARRVDRQPAVGDDVAPAGQADVGGALVDQADPFVDGEHARRLLVVVHHGDDDVAEQLGRLLDDVEVAEVDRVEAAGIEHRAHGWSATVVPAGGRYGTVT